MMLTTRFNPCRRWCHAILALLFLAMTCMAAPAAVNKSRFDLAGPPSSSLAKGAGMTSDRTLLTRSMAEASMIDGGYYTLGTTSGVSSSTLDDRCTITYGHPYAKTSYPLVNLDGVWAKPEAVFPMPSGAVQSAGDSLTLDVTLPGTLELRFTLRIDAQDGSVIHLRSVLKNLDTRAHTLGLGLVFDPSVGKSGDCAITLGGVPIVRDTLLSSVAQQPIVLSERSSALSGLKVGMSFPSGSPSPFIIGNWNDLYTSDDASLPQSDARTLYDALMKMYWPTSSVAPQSTISSEVVVTLLPPVFGAGMFLRWDVPSAQSVENGIPFPKQFTSTVTCSNTSMISKSGLSIQTVLPTEVQTSPSIQTVAVGALNSSYVSVPLTVKEINEAKVVMLRTLCLDNGVVVDSLVMPFRICSSPVSDTGLVVTIDSVMSPGQSKIALTFDVQKKFPQQYLYGLDQNSIFLYENNTRITDFTLGKDTTGGAGSIDIVFVFDVTGSMSNSITGVKNNIIEFTDSLAKRGIDYRLGMVTFLDEIESVYNFTSDPALFKSYVSAQYAHGGGDTPENSLDALYRATQMPFRATAHKIFIWITDANYHEKDTYTQRTRQEVINQLLATDVVVHSIGAKTYQTDWYTPIVSATGGNYYDIAGNFRDILLDIGNLKGSSRYLASYTSSFYTGTARTIRLAIHYAGLGGSASVVYAGQNKTNGPAQAVACFPNPFNPQTTIRMEIPEAAHASIVIYNVLGQEVRRFSVAKTAGVSQVMWNAKNDAGQDVSTGIYFVRVTMLSASDDIIGTQVAKLLYLK